ISDHAVARNDDRNRIGAICRAYGANCFRLSNTIRKPLVRDRFPVRDLLQLGPYCSLKLRAFRDQRQRKSLALACKVFLQLSNDFIEERAFLRPARIDRDSMPAARKADVVEPRSRARQQQGAYGTFIPGIRKRVHNTILDRGAASGDTSSHFPIRFHTMSSLFRRSTSA